MVVMNIEFYNLYQDVTRYQLLTSEAYRLASRYEIESTWNGIGAAWLPDWLLTALNSYLRIFKAAALVHDYDYSNSTRNEDARLVADKRFFDNMILILKCYYAWYHPMYYVRYRDARLAYRAVRMFGEKSFMK